jgi:ribosome-associated translation inhibitor RaiA
MTLKWNLVSKGMRAHAQLHAKLREKIQKLERQLEHFPEDAVELQVALEHHPKKGWFKAGLSLFVPSNVLHAEKRAVNPISALDQAVKVLLRELAVLKAGFKHKHDWHEDPQFRTSSPVRASRMSPVALSYFRA